MSSAFEALQPLVEWCDRPPPTDLRQAHIVRTVVLPNAEAKFHLHEKYYGILVFARSQGQQQFTGIAVWSDIEQFPVDTTCMKIRMSLFPQSGTVRATFTACTLNDELSAGPAPTSLGGAVFHPFEATEVQPSGTFFGGLRLMVDGRFWVMWLGKSTVGGLESTTDPP